MNVSSPSQSLIAALAQISQAQGPQVIRQTAVSAPVAATPASTEMPQRRASPLGQNLDIRV